MTEIPANHERRRTARAGFGLAGEGSAIRHGTELDKDSTSGATPMAEQHKDLSNEVLIQQSVMTARGMPVLLLGNPAAVAVIAWFNWADFFSSYAVIPAAFLLVLLIPMAVSSARLRHKPRPKKVSERRNEFVDGCPVFRTAWC